MFASIETKIIERLEQGQANGQIVGVRILKQSEMDEARDLRQMAPFVAVVYDGFTPGQSIGNGVVQQISQDWWLVVGTKSARGRGQNIAARDQAGQLSNEILELLLGLNLGGGAYLRLRESPGPEYEDGYCYLPIGFTSAATFKGKP